MGVLYRLNERMRRRCYYKIFLALISVFLLACLSINVISNKKVLTHDQNDINSENVNVDSMNKMSSAEKNKLLNTDYSTFVLSYSCYGEKSSFIDSIEEVASEAASSSLYSTWKIKIYHDNIPEDKQINLRKKYPNLIFVDVRIYVLEFPLVGGMIDDIYGINAHIWRFIPLADMDVDVMCSRDLDSILSTREEEAVKEWLATDKSLHVMRDSLHHTSYIMGGMWCFRITKNRIEGQKILEEIFSHAKRRIIDKKSNSAIKEADRGDDQILLSAFLWSVFKDDALQHDSYLCHRFQGSQPFPTKRENGFIGCIRPCAETNIVCPEACRPKNHKDWIYC